MSMSRMGEDKIMMLTIATGTIGIPDLASDERKG
jgi:hypothetical protein